MRSGLGAVVLGLALAVPAAAQQQFPNVLFKGSLVASGPGGYDERTLMSCRGAPTCTGEYRAHVRQEGCVNYTDFSGSIVITGLNLAQSGALQGTLTARGMVRDTPP